MISIALVCFCVLMVFIGCGSRTIEGGAQKPKKTRGNGELLTMYYVNNDTFVLPIINSYNKMAKKKYRFEIRKFDWRSENSMEIALAAELLSGGGSDTMLFSENDFYQVKAYMENGVFRI